MEHTSSVRETALELFKYCPVCKAALKKRDVCDILVLGLTCEDHHHFSVPLEEVPSNQHERQFLGLRSDFKNRDEIATDWLTKSVLRRHLNHQVAEVLRIFLEIKSNIYNGTKQNEAAKMGIRKFCAICGQDMKSYDPGWGYTGGLACIMGHKFQERAYTLFFEQDGNSFRLSLDPKYNAVQELSISFTTKSEWEKMIAPQVREILRQYADVK